MIEFFNALSRHLQRHSVAYVIIALFAAVATAGALYGRDTRKLERLAESAKSNRNRSDC